MAKPRKEMAIPETTFRKLLLFFNETIFASFIGFIALIGAIWVTDIKPGNLQLPVASSDLVGSYMMAKEIQDTGSLFSYYPFLGFPYGQDWSLQPFTNFLSVLEMKIIQAIGFGPIASTHVFFLAGFALIGFFTYIFFRILKISKLQSAIYSLAFAWLPWHFLRLQHVWLANYWIIPIGLMWIFLLIDNQKLVSINIKSNYRVAIGILLGLLVGFQDSYFAVFFLVIACCSLIFNLNKRSSGIPIISKIFILISGFSSFCASILLSVWGPNRSEHLYSPVIRTVGEQFSTGGNLSSLFIPLLGGTANSDFESFWSPILRNPLLGQDGNSEGIAYFSWIVALASLLTIITTFWLIFSSGNSFQNQKNDFKAAIRPVAGIYLVSLLFFVSSGFGLFFGLIVSPQIRVWARLSPVIALLSLVSLSLWVSYISKIQFSRIKAEKIFKIFVNLILISLLMLSFGPRIPVARDAEITSELINYNKNADVNLPGGCPILNFPVIAFPEGGLIEGAKSTDIYSDLLPYLFSENRPFSFGAMKGQLGGLWYERIAQNPSELVVQAKSLGFCGIQLDLTKLEDPEQTYIQFQNLLGPPVADASDRWFLFSLNGVAPSADYSNFFDQPEFWATKGFYLPEFEDHKRFWWADASSDKTTVLGNPAKEKASVSALFRLELPPCLTRQLIQVSSPNGAFPTQTITFEEGENSKYFDLNISIPGESVEEITFHSSNSCSTTNDVRTFSFRIFTPELTF